MPAPSTTFLQHNSRGENVQRPQTEASDQWSWCAGKAWENTSTDHEKVLVVECPTRTSGKFNISYIEIKNTKSTGHDQINLQRIKEGLMVTIPYITLIINTSMVTKVFPTLWKHSIIIPIHKSGDIEEPTNFRPINLLPILSKILEKILLTHINWVLRNNNLLNENSICLSL